MTEEIIEDIAIEEVAESNFSTEEKRAVDGGWKPLEEWEGDEEEWIDARTFNMRGELMDRIKSQTSQLRGQDRKIQKLEETMSHLAEHNRKMDEIAFQKALKELKGLKREALEMFDHEQVIEIDEKIDELKSFQKSSAKSTIEDTGSDQVNTEVAEWVEQNDWYRKDITLRGAADALASEIVQTYPELRNNPSEVLKKVTMRLKSEFPSKFGDKHRRPTNMVSEPGQGDVSNRSKGSVKKYTAKHLNELQMGYGKTFVKDGVMKSLDEYASQLAELGELDVQKGA